MSEPVSKVTKIGDEYEYLNKDHQRMMVDPMFSLYNIVNNL